MNGRAISREERMAIVLKRRRAVVRKQRAAIAFFTALVFIALFSVFSVKKAYANDNINDVSPTKVYKSVMIYSGDTVESISMKYMDDKFDSFDHLVYEIKEINHISEDDGLIAGNYIIVPQYIL